MNCVTVASNKGGVGKTTTAVTVAVALSKLAPTVLLDFDSQGQTALWLGRDPAPGVYKWLMVGDEKDDGFEDLTDTTMLFWLPGDSRTKAVEKMYRDVSKPDFLALVEDIRRLRSHFEYVVIDTAPSGVLQEVAIAAADVVVVPFKAEAPGLMGAYGTRDMLAALEHQARAIYLPVDYYRQVVEQRQSLADFRRTMGDACEITTPIPHRIAVAEAVAYGKTIWAYENKNLEEVRLAYGYLLDAILGWEGGAWYERMEREGVKHG